MEIVLENIGVIKEAKIKIDGVTIITGYNNSGKTTVGRAVYALISAVENLLPRAKADKANFIINGIFRGLEQFLPANIYSIEENLNMSNSLSIRLAELIKQLSESGQEMLNELLEQTDSFYQALINSTDDVIVGMYKEQVRTDYGTGIIQRKNSDGFKKEQEEINIYKKMLDEDPEALRYADRRIVSSLQTEFYNQVTPLRYRDRIGSIRLLDKETAVFEVLIKNNKPISEKHMYIPTTNLAVTKAYMIDEAQDLDEIIRNRGARRNRAVNFGNISREAAYYLQISGESHKSYLAKHLLPYESTYENIVAEENAEIILDKIHSVFDDTIVYERGSLICAGSKLDVRNLAAGTKMFAMLHQLIMNRCLDERTVLILDEPDSHLHPEWQLLLAEILFLINRDLGVKIILTTHSVDFLYAMDVYNKDYGSCCNVYDTEILGDEYSVNYEEVTDNLTEVYAKLGSPFQKMRKKEIENDSE